MCTVEPDLTFSRITGKGVRLLTFATTWVITSPPRLSIPKMTALPGALRPSLLPKITFISFNITIDRQFSVYISHVLADFMRHAPCRFIGYAELTPKLPCSHIVPRRGKQVHGIEPLVKRGTGSFHGRPHARVNVVLAVWQR